MNRRFWKRLSLGAGAVLLLTSLASACSPMYVIRAGIAEAKILRARRPIPEVILDPTTDDRTKTKLTFVVEARNYAIDVFELDVGRSYRLAGYTNPILQKTLEMRLPSRLAST